jgi:RNA recognition motif-containing protein
VEDANRALVEAHNTIIDNRHIRVEQARVNRTLFIAKFNRSQPDQVSILLITGRTSNGCICDNLRFLTFSKQVRETLQRYGPIEELTLLQNYQTGRSKGCGFVKFCFREDAIKAFLVSVQT